MESVQTVSQGPSAVATSTDARGRSMSPSTVQPTTPGGRPSAPAPDAARPGRGSGGERDMLDAVAWQLRDHARRYDHNLRFTVDQATGRQVIKVLDPRTDEVIRQIPPEEALALARFLQNLGEEGGGALLRAEA